MIQLTAGGTVISTAYTIGKAKTPTQIVNRGLDGTTYVQVIGEATTTYKLRAVIDTEAARDTTDNAWQTGAPITANGQNIGVITAVTYQGPLPGGKYLADITTVL